MRFFLLAVCCSLAAAQAEDPKDLVRRAIEADSHNEELARNYTFLEREDMRMLDGGGKIKSRTIKTWDITLLEGSPYKRLVGRDDKPLAESDEKKEQEKLRNSIEQRRKETPQTREQRIADWDRRRKREREQIKELPDGFDFRIVGEEQFNGVPAWVVEGTPHKGYKPKTRMAEFLTKVKGRIWISKIDYQGMKVEMETLDTISVGGFLLRLAKGGRIVVEQTRVNDELWMPKHVAVIASAHVVLVKGYHLDLDYTFSDYKKFQAESRIVDQ
jgi:hypothetical protein